MKTHHLLKVPLLASALNNYAPVYAQGGEDGVAETICGPNDDRVRSFDVRQGRLQPIGCTAWLISENVFLTAGHCAADQAGQDPLVHFTSGAEDAPLEDQYAVDLSSYKSVLVPTEEGLIDWAAGRLHRNPLTGKWPGVAQTQKCGAQGCGWYSLGPVPSQVSENDITIIGYGEIEGRVFPQTIHTGPLVNINKYELHYRTDSTVRMINCSVAFIFHFGPHVDYINRISWYYNTFD